MYSPSYWNELENMRQGEYLINEKHEAVMEVLQEKGYEHIHTNEFVPEADAYEYALEKCLHGDEHDEFKEMLVEWFYSGNWVPTGGSNE